ncbi:MAG: D-alanyl-D-alanine carboxypeptidase family protein [Dethiobacteria bacterium]|nr:D-alanyl-D-alanine carboxypeptidase [Bacillota bacterium]HOP69468.1 D-alanyl-D-alanine carboxypeptidase family protein [Bacillota bacterium]HPT34426.1 D-alanyl-D-alanine carboxypeptidase family protein [Bacillota bacterium]
MNLYKRICGAVVLVLFLAASLLPVSAASREVLDLHTDAAVLIEAETGTLLYAGPDAEKPMPPASLTKIMTLLIAMEEMERGAVDWDTPITASQKAWETGGSTMFLNIGQQATFRDLIRGICIVSANDACVAIAEYLYGSEAAFVEQMNRRAKELGLENTHFVNSHGLHDDDHYMSPLDVARLAAYFIKTQPEAARFQSEREFTFNDIRQFNRNPLLGNFPGADGIKTGSTPEAGYCLAATSKQDGMRLISVVMNTPGNEERGEDSRVLLNYGFRNFQFVVLAEAGETVTTVPVTRGRRRELPATAKAPIRLVIPRHVNENRLEQVFSLPDSVKAPVEKGTPLGSVQVKLEGETLAEMELLAGDSVEKLGFFASLWRSIGDSISNLWQKIWSKVSN